MRLYGKRFVANRIDARISDHKETRDAIVYDIDVENRRCRVRIAGTDVLVRAWFPVSYMSAPSWLKVDGAVRIAHVGGDKSRVEVVSPGLVQPAYVVPQASGGQDAVLLGMMPSAGFEDVTGMTVRIGTGTYRIGGAAYAFAPTGPGMDNPGWYMGDGGDMSGAYWLGTVDPISAHAEGELWFRYDAFVIGADGVVDYIKGVEWQWTGVFGDQAGPVKPSVPIGHVLVRNYVLLWSGVTAITQANIGREWEAPRPESLVVENTYAPPYHPGGGARTIPDFGVVWGGSDIYEPIGEGYPRMGAVTQDMNASAVVTVMDQYGYPYSWWTDGAVNELEFQVLGGGAYNGYGDTNLGLGVGNIPNPTDESGGGTPVRVSLGLGSSYNISYRRLCEFTEQLDNGANGYPGYYTGDESGHSANIGVRLVSDAATHPVFTIINFFVLDASGNPM